MSSCSREENSRACYDSKGYSNLSRAKAEEELLQGFYFKWDT